MKDTGASSSTFRPFQLDFLSFRARGFCIYSARASLEVLFSKALHRVALHSPHGDGNCMF